ncbi:hypothetical protein CFOL_v3_06169, partial [Cephalotus follicularis]
GATIKMANNAEFKVVGIGLVQIRMFDGVLTSLTNVQYVSDLRKDLISMGTLDLRGCKCTIECGVITVTKGALIKLHGMMIEKLYRLIGTVQTGGGSLRSQTSATVEERGYEIVCLEIECISRKKRVTFVFNLESDIDLAYCKIELESYLTSRY